MKIKQRINNWSDRICANTIRRHYNKYGTFFDIGSKLPWWFRIVSKIEYKTRNKKRFQSNYYENKKNN